jgi:hypothetical protein
MEELLEEIEGLGMDLWGKAGKAKNPTTGHFDSRIFAWQVLTGVSLWH